MHQPAAGLPESMQALNMNGIRRQIFHQWLASPRFMLELQTNLECCYIQARVEMIRDFPHAIKTALNITDKLMRPEEYRRLCSELVRLYSDFGRMERAAKRPQPAVVEPARLDVFVEQCGVKLSPGGVIQASAAAPKIAQNRVFQFEKPQNTQILHPNPPTFSEPSL